jgi:competence protein ComEC
VGRAVADAGNPQRRTRAKAGIRTWPVDLARQAWGAAWLQPQFAVPARIREWAGVEVGAGRLLPWFAVAFGAGIVLYFTADHEPALWAAGALAVVAGVGVVLLRRRPLGFVLGLGLFAIAAGFAVATASSPSTAPAATRLPCANGWPPTRMAVT